MDHATGPRMRGAKMTIKVYTVSPEGIVSAPSATINVPYGSEPELELIGLNPPCECPQCRAGQAVTR